MATQRRIKHIYQIRSRWSSYGAFLLAAIGSSIGLGNIWKFPYEMGQHGGGTFLAVYIPCLLLVAFPLMLAEVLIGRRGHSNPVDSVAEAAQDAGTTSLWQAISWVSMFTAFVIFSFYSVVASWILFYIMQSASGSFVEVPAEIVQNSFGALLHNTNQMLIWHTVFVLSVIVVLARGIEGGLERALRWLMPLFLILLIGLCVYAAQIGDFTQAYQFVFSFDLEQVTPGLFVSALSQALFSLSIGMGILIMYGAYLKDEQPIFTGAAVILIFDTLAAVIMALLIFSIVFAFEMQPDAGPGLIFQTLPVAFSQMSDNSVLISTAFFSLLLVAALTSGFALLEPIIQFIVDRLYISRRVAAWCVGAAAWWLGWLSLYSFNSLNESYNFQFYYFGVEQENGFFDFLNILTTNVLLPFSALLIAIFTGWKLSRTVSKQTLSIRFEWGFRIWRFCTKIITPLIIAAVLLIVLFIPA